MNRLHRQYNYNYKCKLVVMGQQGPTNAVSVAGVRVQEWKFPAYALPAQKEYGGRQTLSDVKTSMGLSNVFSV